MNLLKWIFFFIGIAGLIWLGKCTLMPTRFDPIPSAGICPDMNSPDTAAPHVFRTWVVSNPSYFPTRLAKSLLDHASRCYHPRYQRPYQITVYYYNAKDIDSVDYHKPPNLEGGLESKRILGWVSLHGNEERDYRSVRVTGKSLPENLADTAIEKRTNGARNPALETR